jgi:hypothetical protein
MNGVPVVAWVMTGLLLVLVLVSYAAGRGGIPVNHFVGIRIPPLTRNAGAWRAGHAAAVVPAGVAFIVALVFSVVGIASPAAYAGSIVAFVGGVVWAFLRAAKAAG